MRVGISLVKSVGHSDTEILQNIQQLYAPNGFDLDPTYSKGIFYKDISEPRLKYDLKPQIEGVEQADCRCLPLESGLIENIVFDPPFMFGTHGQTKNNRMNQRFTMFDSFSDLCSMYQDSLKEFYRILTKKGYLFFKCQDYTDSKTTITHCLVYNWATQIGFYAKDIFILVASGGRIYNPNLQQRHARKFHSYWWAFRK
jgi:hypothetical protein